MTSLFHIFSLMPSLSNKSGATSHLYFLPLMTLGIILTRTVSNTVLRPVTWTMEMTTYKTERRGAQFFLSIS